MSVLDKVQAEELGIKVRRLVTTLAIGRASRINPERVRVEVIDMAAYDLARAIVDIATQEEELYEYPGTWWQMFKEQWFPRWLKKRFPVRCAQVWVEHKFPDLEVPQLGKECVSLRVYRYDDVRRAIDRECGVVVA